MDAQHSSGTVELQQRGHGVAAAQQWHGEAAAMQAESGPSPAVLTEAPAAAWVQLQTGLRAEGFLDREGGEVPLGPWRHTQFRAPLVHVDLNPDHPWSMLTATHSTPGSRWPQSRALLIHVDLNPE